MSEVYLTPEQQIRQRYHWFLEAQSQQIGVDYRICSREKDAYFMKGYCYKNPGRKSLKRPQSLPYLQALPSPHP